MRDALPPDHPLIQARDALDECVGLMSKHGWLGTVDRFDALIGALDSLSWQATIEKRCEECGVTTPHHPHGHDAGCVGRNTRLRSVVVLPFASTEETSSNE